MAHAMHGFFAYPSPHHNTRHPVCNFLYVEGGVDLNDSDAMSDAWTNGVLVEGGADAYQLSDIVQRVFPKPDHF